MALVSGNPMDPGPSGFSLSDIAYPTGASPPTIRVLGTSVACATYDSALERIKALAREPRAAAVCPSNTHILGAGLKDRVYGPYFMRHALRNTPRPWRHFFFGDSDECLVELRRVLVQLQPDIEIVGMISPPFRPFTEADEALFADTINRADPDFVWVALPGVRMEQWIIDNQARFRRGVFLAVGDADGVDLGLQVKQGAAPIGSALPAISFDIRILLAMGRPAWARAPAISMNLDLSLA
jgi:N-acetylglucosaminyldiphosphoundecaprenol N-acetyl-beta-D-mannosaminyltransferase